MSPPKIRCQLFNYVPSHFPSCQFADGLSAAAAIEKQHWTVLWHIFPYTRVANCTPANWKWCSVHPVYFALIVLWTNSPRWTNHLQYKLDPANRRAWSECYVSSAMICSDCSMFRIPCYRGWSHSPAQHFADYYWGNSPWHASICRVMSKIQIYRLRMVPSGSCCTPPAMHRSGIRQIPCIAGWIEGLDIKTDLEHLR